MRRLLLAIGFVLSASAVWAQAPVVSAPLSSTTCPGSGCVLLGTSGLGSASNQISGTWSGSISFDASLDGVNFYPVGISAASGTVVPVTSTVANGLWMTPVTGFAQVRVRFSAYTSGTAVVAIAGAQATMARTETFGSNLMANSQTVTVAADQPPLITMATLGLPLPLCNPVRNYACQPKGY